MNCQDIVFSQKQSQQRIERFLRVLPSPVLKKLLFFALYLLGARLKSIAAIVEIPEESGKTTISRVMNDGIAAFQDRRQTAKITKLPKPTHPQPLVSAFIEEGFCEITFGDRAHPLKIPQDHRLHLRTILLSLLQADYLPAEAVASILGLTVSHCRELSAKLLDNGVSETLIDKRTGQQRDYLVDLSVKAELIKQFAARSIAGQSTSSQVLTTLINDSLVMNVSSRTIRWHMNRLGLTRIKRTLPALVETLKKTP